LAFSNPTCQVYKEKKNSIGLIKIENENKMVEQLKDPETHKIQATIVRELMGDTLVEVSFFFLPIFQF
jgi:c-di-AMP phosphodiesterase-like protein